MSAVDNPYAFPSPDDGRPNDGYGMTLRDYFAGHALVGLLSNPNASYAESVEDDVVAVDCYFLADAMLKVRARKDLP